MSVNLSEYIPTTTETMTQKFSLYIYWECQTIYLNFLIFSVKKFQEMGTKSLFLSFQNSFSASYFPISQEPFDQNSSLTLLWNNN